MEKAKGTCVWRAVVLSESARGHTHRCERRPVTELSHCQLEAELFLGGWGTPWVALPRTGPRGPPRAVGAENRSSSLQD